LSVRLVEWFLHNILNEGLHRFGADFMSAGCYSSYGLKP
jgi:hypothetical protein